MARARGESAAPRWVTERLVACVGGPLTGQWFTREDWDARCRAAERAAASDVHGRVPTTLRYVETQQTIDHPKHGAAWAYVLAWPDDRQTGAQQ